MGQNCRGLTRDGAWILPTQGLSFPTEGWIIVRNVENPPPPHVFRHHFSIIKLQKCFETHLIKLIWRNQF